ncbi:MAG: beta-N-acetylglucosaminidase domain-containing protein [Hyphomicrobiales bacterium]
MRTFWLSVCCALLLGAADGPASATEKTVPSRSWSSSDPLNIPYKERLRQFVKGNLAPNPSFELGNARNGHRPGAFTVVGWQRLGKQVEWIDCGVPPYTSADCSDGRRAVKIERREAGELAEAAGVLSAYIPVIPGNYDFFYDVRLKDVDGNRRRLGGRLGGAVTVRVLFFDAEKKPLDSTAVNPVSGNPIDTSDKSYSFANFWSIDDFGWARVRARTYNYPFSEGDLPDRTRYVRLFLGLKGTGTLWVDNVDFHFSKWNFSALERMQPYMDRPLSPLDSLIPTPKEARHIREVTYFERGAAEGSAPLIVLPDDPAPADRSAARLLEKKLNAALARVTPAGGATAFRAKIDEGGSADDELPAARLVFSIGQNRLMRKLAPDLPLRSVSGKEQGYVIQPLEAGPCHVVVLAGETSVANFYAAATAAQLLEEGRCVYHSAAVSDYPDFLGRSYLLKRWDTPAELERDLDGLERMSLYKLNKAYAGYEGITKAWHQPDALFKAGVAKAGQWCRNNGVMSLGIMVNPYSHLEFEPAEDSLGDSARYTWTHGNTESLQTLQEVFALGLKAGAGTIMLLADDFVPHEGRNRKNFSLYTPEDRERFVNLQNAQAFVINQLKAWTDREYPGTRFEFCPPWYANEFIDRSEGKAEIYLKELAAQIPRDVAIVWTGPTVRSLSLDMADLRRYRNLIGRWPMFWDNTLYARNLETTVYGGYTAYYPGKVRMCNLFEPLDTVRPPGFHELNDGRHMYVNGAANTEVYRIKFETVVDYEWNTSTYNPEHSLWKALVRSYGAPAAKEILAFNDAYYSLYALSMWKERQGTGDEDHSRGSAYLRLLLGSLASLRQMLPPNHVLLSELEEFRDRALTRVERLSMANPAQR